MTPLTSTSRLRLLSFVVLLGTFFAGSLAGAAFTRVVSADETAQQTRPPSEEEQRKPQERRQRRSILDELGLTPQQDSQIRTIMARTEPKTDSLWDEFRPRIRAVIDSAHAEIDSVLEAPQREKLQQWRKERRDRQRRDNNDRDRDNDRDGDGRRRDNDRGRDHDRDRDKEFML